MSTDPHTDRVIDPHIKFGLECVAMAMRAKLGVLGRAEPMKLILIGKILLPEDKAAARAVAGFAKRCSLDPYAAGAALHDFILHWHGGCMAVDNSKSEPEPPHYAWQDRADLS